MSRQVKWNNTVRLIAFYKGNTSDKVVFSGYLVKAFEENGNVVFKVGSETFLREVPDCCTFPVLWHMSYGSDPWVQTLTSMKFRSNATAQRGGFAVLAGVNGVPKERLTVVPRIQARLCIIKESKLVTLVSDKRQMVFVAD